MEKYIPVKKRDPVSVTNRRLRHAYDAIEALESRVLALESAQTCETVADEEARVVIEPEVVTVDATEEAGVIDWLNSDDEEELIALAKSEGVKCDGRDTVNSLKRKISEHYGLAE